MRLVGLFAILTLASAVEAAEGEWTRFRGPQWQWDQRSCNGAREMD